ncbi:germination protein YpeB [Barrientosiimonas marina]|uniref:Germination protein YpeB n=1 Tax=Lentibacillus kimchii TaxID=1542911 RepID=A0ABW2UWG4_9BACI
MLRWILIGVLALGIAGTGFWGYQEHREKETVMMQAENNYQRAFHELSYHMDLLHNKIGTALAMNSVDQLSPQMAEIWRLTSEATSSAGQLPLTLMPFNQTKAFLSDIGDFTYEAAVRDLDKKPLNDKEIKTLQNLYQQSGELKNEIRQVQHTVLNDGLEWMDVQEALAAQDKKPGNSIIDGFETVEKKVQGYAKSNVDSALTKTSAEKHDYKKLDGETIDQQKAIKTGETLFGADNPDNLSVKESGDGAEIPLYTVTYQNDHEKGHLDITKKGGHPLTLIVDREIDKKHISLNKGLKKAKRYLAQYDFANMEAVSSNQYDNVGFYSFVYNQDGVRLYSDTIEMKIALDNGDLLGMSARNYFSNHKEQDILEPELSIDEAKEKVNPDVTINEENMAVIDSDHNKDVLVYEFLGVMDGETYLIYINAKDGKEEKVKKLNGTEMNYTS